MRKKIVIVQGAQWGSEAKGMVCHALCKMFGVDYAVRTGSINAGHTIVMPNGTRKAFQQLPVAAALPGCKLVLGPGTYINADTLSLEMDAAGVGFDRVVADYNCGVHLNEYTDEAKAAGRDLKIGATGKGCAEAIIHKIADRNVGGPPLLLRDRLPMFLNGLKFEDTALMLTNAYDEGKQIVIEGTQGTLLDFHCGPYPYVTSRQTISSAWVAESGLSPALDYEVVLVARTFPIRVAGNSGPMTHETSWISLAVAINDRLHEFGYPPLVATSAVKEFAEGVKTTVEQMQKDGCNESEIKLYGATRTINSMSKEGQAEIAKLFETTTVTKRLRRIAQLDTSVLRRVVVKERASYVVLTFLNYVFPEVVHTRKLSDVMIKYLFEIQRQIGCWIRFTTIGPNAEDMIPTPDYFADSFKAR